MESNPLEIPRRLFCERCRKPLRGGQGGFYVVRVDAICDPTPPTFSKTDLEEDFQQVIARFNSEIQEKSEKELTNQVYRRKFLCLCAPCYRRWIESPASCGPPETDAS